MDFRILGPLEVVDGEIPLRLAGRRQRALLALLLLHANEVLSGDRLIEDVWGDKPPATGANALQARVSQLRKALAPVAREVLVTQPPGYLLRVNTGELDAECFERLADEGRRALASGDVQTAADLLRSALSLWRGPALADFLYEPFAQGEIARLEEARLACLEERIDADLALKGEREVISELEALIGAHPLRERLRGQLMLALYRSGRQAEALSVYQETRRVLVEELGIEPSPVLQRLQQAILNQEPALELAEPSPPRLPSEEPAPSGKARKTVTLAVIDAVEAGGLAGRDPEILRSVSERYLEAATQVLERHGGAVETLLGNQVIAVFGMPAAHEDDAMRAVRAAVELSGSLARLNEQFERDFGMRLTVRIGIQTGEVVTGEPAQGRRTVVGEAATVAGRLQQAADPGEILLGDETRRLVGDAVRVEHIVLPGQEAVWRLLELVPDALAESPGFDAPLVSRGPELDQLRRAFERASEERTLYLCTLLGSAGIGKSRLAQEFTATLAEKATVLSGRCLSYGEGITFWPLKEVVRQAVGEDAPRLIPVLLRGEADAELISERIAAALGLADFSGAPEELFWAFRKLLEALAEAQPLVVVFEDLHWAEPVFLDLVQYLADFTRDAPILVLCLARPELLEEHATWLVERPNSASILLEPLGEDESRELMDNLASGPSVTESVLRRIAETAEGNPLFLEQLLARHTELTMSDAELALPPTIQALLAARIDRLGPGERAVLERASVEGREFRWSAVVDLLPENARPSAGRHLEALVRKEFVSPERSLLAQDEVLRFRHALIQQAAYRTMSKELRAELHERFAEWLERKAGERLIEVDELLGYHLEQAFTYRSELGPVDDSARELGRRAAEHLAAGGRRALRRGDMPATVNLLERAVSLLEPGNRARVGLLPDLSVALFQVGDLERADTVLAGAIEEALALGDRRLEWQARVQRSGAQLYAHLVAGTLEDALSEAEDAVAVFEEEGDDLGLARAWSLLSNVLSVSGQNARSAEAAERAAEHARRAGSHREEAWAVELFGWAVHYGPTPADEGIRMWERLLEQVRGNRDAEANAVLEIAFCRAMLGDFSEVSREIALRESRTRDLGLRSVSGWYAACSADIELLMDDPAAAERHLRAAYELGQETGDTLLAASASADLARLLYDRTRYEEAAQLVELFDDAVDDLALRAKRQGVRAKLAARRREFERAEALAEEAVAFAEQTDYVLFHARALLDLAEVLCLAGRPDEAAAPRAEAVRLFERKGNIVAARKARAAVVDVAATA
jgi:DNA-binding SARP family transcriptional activator